MVDIKERVEETQLQETEEQEVGEEIEEGNIFEFTDFVEMDDKIGRRLEEAL